MNTNGTPQRNGISIESKRSPLKLITLKWPKNKLHKNCSIPLT